MIEISRALIRQLRTVFQRAIGRATRAHAGPLVFFHAGPDGLDIRATGPDTSIEYHLVGNFEPVLFAVPLSVLAECEGRKGDPVRIELSTGKLHIQWQDGGVPRSKEHVIGKLPAENFPPAPDTMSDVEPGILKALHDATEVSDPESSRYALSCLQLSGSSGKIAATDGRHLLVQSGFSFPWTEDVLVPASNVFGSRELPADQPVRLGRTEKHVTLSIGPWTIYLTINKDGRFPKLDDVIPPVTTAIARLALSPYDGEFLIDTVQRLPHDDALNNPVTLDLNGRVIIRARAEGESQPTEVILSNSSLTGDPIRINTNRQYLVRAAKLGFGEVYLFGKDKAVLANDVRRQYLWMLLATNRSSIPRNRIKEPKVTQPNSAAAETMATTTKPTQLANLATIKSPVEQAIALRDALHEAARQANELAHSLKRQRRQNRLVETTLESLKQLQAAS
jgi:hypothetical protein